MACRGAVVVEGGRTAGAGRGQPGVDGGPRCCNGFAVAGAGSRAGATWPAGVCHAGAIGLFGSVLLSDGCLFAAEVAGAGPDGWLVAAVMAGLARPGRKP